MPEFDLSRDELDSYRIKTEEPDGLDAWWSERLAGARRLVHPPVITRYESGTYGPFPVYDLSFSGADGHRIGGWYLRPPGAPESEPLPTVVTFAGYGAGRGVPVDHAYLPAVGFAQVVMDTRGQPGGVTGDPGGRGEGPHYPGFMTRGIESPESYYYSRIYTDAVLAVEAASELPGVDATRLGVAGGSQGGGLALVAAAFGGQAVRVCQSDVPFLCDFRRAIAISSTLPYREISDFLAQRADLVESAWHTLSYFDVALLARRITAPSLVSVGLMDEVCPPSTVFAAFHEISAPKEIAVYPFGVHMSPKSHSERRIKHLRKHLC